MRGPHGSARRGLTAAEAAERLRRHGPNALPQAASLPLWRRALRQFRSPLIYVLLAALAFDIGSWLYEGRSGWPLESLAIALILLLNAALGALQEHRSEQALAQLEKLAAPRSWALRDGRLAQVDSSRLVPGDLVRLEAGERVPADGSLLEAEGLLLDESVLTGESVPVDKSGRDELLAGTLLVRGSALLELSRTGASSAMGRVAGLVGRLESGRTPLERRLDAFGRRISLWVLGLAAAIVLTGTLAAGPAHLAPLLLFAGALAVAIVPEGLPAVITLTLARGVQRMARRRAVVRRLSAVEALGSVTVIATDKTGTLTENRLVVRVLESDDEDRALLAMALANDAEPAGEAGDPLDRALLEHASGRGLDAAEARRLHPREDGRPFDSRWRFQRATVRLDGRRESFFKGAPEALLERCASRDERRRWLARAAELAAGGLRVIALAAGEGERERGLRALGLVGLWDPPRAEVPEAVAAAQRAGVRVVMITGDHPATALAVARALGLRGAEEGGVLAGAELEALDEAGLRRAAHETAVFARVSPEQKLALVEALQAGGEVVAVTGDGVNDAPALKHADVGVAMGRRGSDVAREVADLVLLDDDFSTIVAAIEEGRGIYANIRSFVRFLFSTNAAEALLIVGGSAAAWLLALRDESGALLIPLTAVQILWVNLITDGPPALALGIDRSAGQLDRPPRPRDEPLLDRASLRFVVAAGLVKAAVAGLVLVLLPRLGAGLPDTRTAVFLYTAVAQLLFAYPARRVGGGPARTVVLHVAVAGGIAVQLATVLLPPLRALLGLQPLDAAGWLAVAAAVAVTWAGAEAAGRWAQAGPALRRARRGA